jgi:hypothetical protein
VRGRLRQVGHLSVSCACWAFARVSAWKWREAGNPGVGAALSDPVDGSYPETCKGHGFVDSSLCIPLRAHTPHEEPLSRMTPRAAWFAQDGNEIFFKIKKSTPFRKLMDAYCKRQGTDENGILFLVDGKRLRPEQTPDEVCPAQHPPP